MFNETDYCSNEMLYITFASRFELQYQKHFSDHYLGINLKTLSSLCFRKIVFSFLTPTNGNKGDLFLQKLWVCCIEKSLWRQFRNFYQLRNTRSILVQVYLFFHNNCAMP